ncbi:MAG: hypothetical protein HYV16_11650 [Gammaproteobacteria bacterium]|nr:hypothetical protein [Gammaproteobacteria bacterium]
MLIRSLILLAASLPLLACSAATVADAEGRSTVVKHGRHPDFAFALVGPDGALTARDRELIVGSGHSDDWMALRRDKRAPQGEYLWFQQGGKDYLLTDPALLAKARAAMSPMRELGERMGELGERMGEYGKELAEAGRRQAEAARRSLAEGELPEPPAPPASPDPDDEIDGELTETGAKLRELGEEMEALSAKQERLAADAEEVVLGLAQEALAEGLARPLER